MITVTKAQVHRAMFEHDLPFYVVKEGSNELDQYQEPGATVADSWPRLENTLNECTGTYVDVVLSNKSKTEKSKGGRDYKQFSYKVRLGQAQSPAAHSPNNDLLREISGLELKLKEFEFNQRLKDIERENEEKTSPLIRLLEKYLTAHTNPTPEPAMSEAPINGAPQNEATQKIKTAINILGKIDKDLPDNLLKFALYAAANPNEYKQLLNLIQ